MKEHLLNCFYQISEKAAIYAHAKKDDPADWDDKYYTALLNIEIDVNIIVDNELKELS